jgi:hypothetical protein
MEAQSADGVVHEFPEGTDQIVIDRVMKSYAQQQPTASADETAGSVGNTLKRGVANIVTGPLDLAAAVANHNPMSWLTNKATDALGLERPKDVAPFGPSIRGGLGIPEMPSDAGVGRQFIENAIPAVLTGGAGAGVSALRAGAAAVPAIARSVLPMLTSTAGSMAGSAVGEKLGGEGGALIGGMAGGAVPGRIMPRSAPMQPKPNAAAIEADARSLNLPPTPAGVLGDAAVQARERQLSGTPGGGPVITGARNQFAEGMRNAAGDIVEQRTAIPAPTPNTAPVIQLAEQTRAAGGDVGRTLQQDLMAKIGNRSNVDVIPILQELERLRGSTDPGTFSPLATRRNQLVQMADEARRTSTTIGPEVNVPYERVKDWRSNLGASLEGQSPVRGRFHGETYGAVTDAMRDTALKSGNVHPEAFDVAQKITANQYMGNKLETALNKNIGQDKAAAARQFAEWWNTRTPEAQAKLSGDPAIRARLDALSRVAHEFNYPTSQTGLTQSLGGQLANATKDAARRAVVGYLGHHFGGPVGAFLAGTGYDKFVGHPLEARAARRFEAQAPQLAGGPQQAPSQTPIDIARLLATMQTVGSNR